VKNTQTVTITVTTLQVTLLLQLSGYKQGGQVPKNINAYLEKLMVRNSSVTLTHVHMQIF
jgi:hypothetical protein